MTEYSSSPQSLTTQQQSPVSRDEIIAILADCEGVELPEAVDDDTLLVIDSYTAIWIQHLLEERHGIVAEVSGQTAGVDSVGALRALVNRDLGVGQA